MKRSAAAPSVDNDRADKRAKFWSGDSHFAQHGQKKGTSSFSDDSHPPQHGQKKWASSSSGDAHPATSALSILEADLLEKLMEDMTTIVATAHQASREPRPVRDKAWKLAVRSKAFATTINSLQRAYAKMLHEATEDEWSSDLAASVRDLADAVVWKLEVNCPGDAAEGKRLMKKMLEHLQVEFIWGKRIAILEAAAEVARTKKADSYRDAQACQKQLREIRRTGLPEATSRCSGLPEATSRV